MSTYLIDVHSFCFFCLIDCCPFNWVTNSSKNIVEMDCGMRIFFQRLDTLMAVFCFSICKLLCSTKKCIFQIDILHCKESLSEKDLSEKIFAYWWCCLKLLLHVNEAMVRCLNIFTEKYSVDAVLPTHYLPRFLFFSWILNWTKC